MKYFGTMAHNKELEERLCKFSCAVIKKVSPLLCVKLMVLI